MLVKKGDNKKGDSMRGLFFIMKGQYKKGVEPSVINNHTGDINYIGGFNPDNDTTEEWYMLVDRITFQCSVCGGDYNKVLKGVGSLIKRHKGSLKKYLKFISDTTSDDTYEVMYLGHPPLTPEKRQRKAVGRCPRTSPTMRCFYQEVYNHYGDYYSDDIKVEEEKVYEDLKGDTLLGHTKKLMKKKKLLNTTIEKKEETPLTPQPLLKKVGLRKIKKL